MSTSDPRTWELAAPITDPTRSWLLPLSTAIGWLNEEDTMSSRHLWWGPPAPMFWDHWCQQKMVTFCRCQQYPIDVYYHGYRKKWKEMKMISRLFSYFAWLEWPCVAGRWIRLKIGNNVIEKKIHGSIKKSGVDFDVASAPSPIKK